MGSEARTARQGEDDRHDVLSNDADDSLAMKPEVGEKTAAAIGGTFFRTGRFVKDQLVKSVEHLRKTWAQELQKSFGER